MRKLFFYLGMVLSSCNPGANSFFSECETRPHTRAEQKFLERLRKDSITNVILSRFDYNYRPDYPHACENYNGVYRVLSNNTPVKLYEDSTKLAVYLEELIKDVYLHNMDDSLKYYTPCIEIILSNTSKSIKGNQGTKAYALVSREDLEAYFGRRLVSGKKGLKWEAFPKTTELKVCTVDSCGRKWWYGNLITR